MVRDISQEIEQHLEARLSRRMKAEERHLLRLERREVEAEKLVGELCRNGQTIHYINVRNIKGELTGKTREFPGPQGFGEAVHFLIRNNYA